MELAYSKDLKNTQANKAEEIIPYIQRRVSSRIV